MSSFESVSLDLDFLYTFEVSEIDFQFHVEADDGRLETSLGLGPEAPKYVIQRHIMEFEERTKDISNYEKLEVNELVTSNGSTMR